MAELPKPLPSRAWSCNTLANGVSFMKDQLLTCKEEAKSFEDQLEVPLI